MTPGSEASITDNRVPGSNGGADYDRLGAAPFLIYLAVSVLTFGRSLIGDWSGRYIGSGADPSQFMWYLRWWPYAIAHHLNPFHPRIIWPPSGVNIAWSASIPLPSLLAYPLTAKFGLVATFNLLCLLCPALAGWAAFMVCRLVSRSYWPSILGGFIFAFSAHMLGKTYGNLNDALVFPVPLALYLAILWFGRRIRSPAFVVLLSLLLVTEFLCFIETFATMSLFGGLALLIAIAMYEGDERRRLLQMIGPLALSFAITLAVLTPYLIFLFAHRTRSAEIMSANAFSIDPINFFIPSPLNELGRIPWFSHISTLYSGGLMESGGYLSPPLIIIAILFALSNWHETRYHLMVDLLAIILVLSLGPRLHLLDWNTRISLLWAPFTYLPFIQKALPARFMLYAFLDLAMMASLWLSSLDARPLAKTAIAGLTILFLLPNLSATYWTVETGIPEFFSGGLYKRYLSPRENVIILPYGMNGDTMLWQAASNMYFNMVQGWTGFPMAPMEFENWPIMDALLQNADIPGVGSQLKDFLTAYGVKAVIVAQDCNCTWQYLPWRFAPRTWSRAPISGHDSILWHQWLTSLGVTPVQEGGVLLYRTPAQWLATKNRVNVIDLKSAEEDQRLPVILKAAALYVQDGYDPADLSPLHAAEANLLPSGWISQDMLFSDPGTSPLQSDILLTAIDKVHIAVGVVAPYTVLKPLVAEYGALASNVSYLSMDVPRVIEKDPASATEPLLLILTFDRKSLIEEAAKLESRQSKWNTTYARAPLNQ
ncbi:MAG TPA: hypothetical protein VMF50_03575 [Candidatus Binataceae bacterium]|nr:hypothetical protein [Candidatus Binataceae bacterium]